MTPTVLLSTLKQPFHRSTATVSPCWRMQRAFAGSFGDSSGHPIKAFLFVFSTPGYLLLPERKFSVASPKAANSAHPSSTSLSPNSSPS